MIVQQCGIGICRRKIWCEFHRFQQKLEEHLRHHNKQPKKKPRKKTKPASVHLVKAICGSAMERILFESLKSDKKLKDKKLSNDDFSSGEDIAAEEQKSKVNEIDASDCSDVIVLSSDEHTVDSEHCDEAQELTPRVGISEKSNHIVLSEVRVILERLPKELSNIVTDLPKSSSTEILDNDLSDLSNIDGDINMRTEN